MRGGIKFLVFLSIVAIAGILLLKPIKNYFSALYPDEATKKERQVIGTVSGYNAQVYEIQRILKTLGFDAGLVNGKMDQQTRTALEAFQKKNNIAVTGMVDTKTLYELRKQADLRVKKTSSSVQNKGVVSGSNSSFDIKSVQSLLRRAGFYKGELDGKMGPETVKAIKQFQKSKGLKESGILNAKTWEALKKVN